MAHRASDDESAEPDTTAEHPDEEGGSPEDLTPRLKEGVDNEQAPELERRHEPGDIDFNRSPWQGFLAHLKPVPHVWRSKYFYVSALSLVGGLAFLLWPRQGSRALAVLVGVIFVIRGVALIFAKVGADTARRSRVVEALVLIPIGIGLCVSAGLSEEALGRALGIAGLALVLRHVLVHRHDEGSRGALVAVSAVGGATSALVVAFPGATLGLITSAATLLWMGLSTVVLASYFGTSTAQLTYVGALERAIDWVVGAPKRTEDRNEVLTRVLYSGRRPRQSIISFYTLMTLASVISALGVITDSTAVVIGAMIIAPLMTPLLGVSVALVMGWPNHLVRISLIAAGGSAVSVAVGVLVGLISPLTIDLSTNTQFTSRATPTLTELMIAVAAGAAGAYATARPRAAGSLTGVAVAIALVPPLSVVGVSYSQLNWATGNGALLLFATNTVAILITGGFVFVITGISPLKNVEYSRHRLWVAFAAVAVLAAVILGNLFFNDSKKEATESQQSKTEAAVNDWLAGSDHFVLEDITIGGDTVDITVLGPDKGLPDPQELSKSLASIFEVTPAIDISHVIATRTVIPGD